jgi:hypothetical protein
VTYRPVLAAPSIVVRRCNPYGHESGGPKHLIGGVYGPEYEGKYHWVCHNPVTVRARMECIYWHRGQIMDLCRAHCIEIQRRQAGLCPKCAWPPEALMWNESIQRLQNELAVIALTDPYLHSPRAGSIKLQIEDAGQRMTELWQRAIIKKVGLKLTEIS